MAVYKLFPTKDTTLYSLFPNMNTGLDEIVEATTMTLQQTPVPNVSRFLVDFSNTEITNTINNKVGDNLWQANLRLFTAEVTGLDLDTTVKVHPLAANWGMGTGKYLDNPATDNGASWIWVQYSGSTQTPTRWSTLFNTSNITGSYNSSYAYAGGGAWYLTGSDSGVILEASQTFSYGDTLDLDLNVTDIVHNWYSGSITQHGFIVKQSASQEFVANNNFQTELKYFSVDTHTIYPPCLEIKWDDFVYSTSSTIAEVSTPAVFVSLDENPGLFYSESINRFRINCRPKYPARTFQTASLYTTQHYLPTASYWAIQDLETNEYIVDFDTTYTKISSDTTSSYFDVYMDGLQPERNYKILIQTTIQNSTLVLDDNYYFKVRKG